MTSHLRKLDPEQALSQLSEKKGIEKSDRPDRNQSRIRRLITTVVRLAEKYNRQKYYGNYMEVCTEG